ncbi:hypothetical protein FHS42_004831 [Streptomyces zagrosensis]|uniref:Uncharacterized protein n=1 Tax=Streptomyces zagrosensis TaxID=1042984 RepID=A0A7W9QEV7_9ACTN|nr:hypothetical protein [Streptomyces zagrosensis]
MYPAWFRGGSGALFFEVGGVADNLPPEFIRDLYPRCGC